MVNTIYIDEITRILKEEGAEKVILFGSYANGNADENSDLDLLVITPEDFIPQTNRQTMDIYHRYNSGIRKFRESVSIDLLVYTHAMFDAIMAAPNSFFKEIDEKGKILYEAVN
jgi:predicted nucleotidyltransferase